MKVGNDSCMGLYGAVPVNYIVTFTRPSFQQGNSI
jgi:hypothetical protein